MDIVLGKDIDRDEFCISITSEKVGCIAFRINSTGKHIPYCHHSLTKDELEQLKDLIEEELKDV